MTPTLFSTSTRWLRLGLMLFSLLLITLAEAQASAWNNNTPGRFSSWLSNGSSPQFLPAERAFQPEAWIEGRQVFVRWSIEPGYYLYQHSLALESDADSLWQLGELSYAPSIAHHDEYFGESQVYYQQAEIRAELQPQTDLAADQPIEITLRYQGCADAGLCYPPQQQRLSLASSGFAPGASLQVFAASESVSSPRAAPPSNTSSQLTERLASSSAWVIVAVFVLAGLALTFTPCVLPMLPILSAIILGKGENQTPPSARRGFLLSSAYVLGMALTYALIGWLVGWFGAGLNLQATLQSPWLLIPFALLFVLLALAMFGVWQLRLPDWLDQRLQALQQPRGATFFHVALMGAISTLVVSPCLTAPLAGALAFIAATGQATTGALALFAMGLGMGIPLIITGTFGARWLPKAGAWMNQVKHFFGFLLLVVALWLVDRLLPPSVSLIAWGVLLLAAALALGALHWQQRQGWALVRLTLAISLLVYALSLMIGGLSGSQSLLQPLASLQPSSVTNSTASAPTPRLNSLDQLEQLISQQADQMLLIDFYADWCISCRIMDTQVFPQPEIQEQLNHIQRVKFDLTQIDPDTRQWLQEYGVFGPPTFMFFYQGEEWRDWRLVGEMNTRELSAHLQALNQAWR